VSRKYNNILDQIGETPLVPIHKLKPSKDVEILAKLESFNPGGSVKDRPALYMIEAAEDSGELTKDKIVIEATSGNTGIGLALVASVKGYRILLTMPESASEERVKTLNAMGAQIQFTPARLGTDGAIETAYKMVREDTDKYWLADQFNNDANWMAHYYGTAMEIWEQTGGELLAIVAAMGTTGTLMGLSRRFKELQPAVQIIGVEPYLGHRIQGLKNMKESYRPGIFDKKRLDRIINIDDEEAYYTARMLAKEEGVFVGMSSGAAMAAALRVAGEMSEGRVVVILPDGGERYLSTPLFEVKKKSGLRLYNTKAHKKEEFIPIEENCVTMYSCGPTLCHPIQLGQCRRFLFSDLIRRYLEFKGYRVIHTMNLTDLDDRTIEGAQKDGLSLKEFTSKYHRAFLDDLGHLNIRRANAYPKASEHVDDMIELTQKLLEKGYAYEKFRSIYFDISRFKDYGKLSRIDLDKIRLGKTVNLDQYEKENPRDFTLLKRSTLNELKSGIFYETRWGNVRPSWHLECSAIAVKYLPPPYDIHTGGIDLIFPHHENAIAISQAATDESPANYWVHNELVMIDGKKPSRFPDKNTLFLREILSRGYSGREVRYWLLSHHYRKPIHFTWSKLETARNTGPSNP
jgi:cysteinyl-tRNA synthetase